jgi:hypothetical protein
MPSCPLRVRTPIGPIDFNHIPVRIPVIPATQSSAMLPRNPEEACHLIQTKAATPSERSDA